MKYDYSTKLNQAVMFMRFCRLPSFKFLSCLFLLQFLCLDIIPIFELLAQDNRNRSRGQNSNSIYQSNRVRRNRSKLTRSNRSSSSSNQTNEDSDQTQSESRNSSSYDSSQPKGYNRSTYDQRREKYKNRVSSGRQSESSSERQNDSRSENSPGYQPSSPSQSPYSSESSSSQKRNSYESDNSSQSSPSYVPSEPTQKETNTQSNQTTNSTNERNYPTSSGYKPSDDRRRNARSGSSRRRSKVYRGVDNLYKDDGGRSRDPSRSRSLYGSDESPARKRDKFDQYSDQVQKSRKEQISKYRSNRIPFDDQYRSRGRRDNQQAKNQPQYPSSPQAPPTGYPGTPPVIVNPYPSAPIIINTPYPQGTYPNQQGANGKVVPPNDIAKVDANKPKFSDIPIEQIDFGVFDEFTEFKEVFFYYGLSLVSASDESGLSSKEIGQSVAVELPILPEASIKFQQDNLKFAGTFIYEDEILETTEEVDTEHNQNHRLAMLLYRTYLTESISFKIGGGIGESLSVVKYDNPNVATETNAGFVGAFQTSLNYFFNQEEFILGFVATKISGADEEYQLGVTTYSLQLGLGF